MVQYSLPCDREANKFCSELLQRAFEAIPIPEMFFTSIKISSPYSQFRSMVQCHWFLRDPLEICVHCRTNRIFTIPWSICNWIITSISYWNTTSYQHTTARFFGPVTVQNWSREQVFVRYFKTSCAYYLERKTYYSFVCPKTWYCLV